ncbi:MAG: neutral/alkaline non-lysosomal ceramidase N-terminal domain-containing protein, partial [Clostridia bacterium]|nr:neutral/alkaline non-lysosomal ceramidase N-terminal domain-containing protein [Clostridia bacterium]
MCDNTRFLAGAAREDVTPKVGTCLYGYVPNHHSQSVHDGLSVTALALQSEKTKALVITAEIGNICNELSDELRSAISEKTDVPFEHIVISCTHTHSAPNLTGSEGWGEVDREYYDEFFAPGTLSAAKKAVSNLADAEIAVGVTESLVGINRRSQNVDGSIGLGQNPHGCYDPNMTVVCFRNAQTKEGILNLIHYSCHGTSAGRNVEITRDWSGVMIDRLECESRTLTAYFNGACGDVGPRLSNGGTCGDIHHVEEMGGLAAADAMRAYKARGGYHKGKLEVFADTLHLPYAPLPTLA